MFLVNFSRWFLYLSVIPLHFFCKIYQMRKKVLQTVRIVFLLFCCVWWCNNFIHLHQILHPVILIFFVNFCFKRWIAALFQIMTKSVNYEMSKCFSFKQCRELAQNTVPFNIFEQASFCLSYDILLFFVPFKTFWWTRKNDIKVFSLIFTVILVP